jgi:hypothetical protein
MSITMITTGRLGHMSHSAPAMQNIPRPKRSLEDRIMDALQPGLIKTFSQLEMGCGGLDPFALASQEVFSEELDKELRRLMAEGKVRCVARRPALCFERGTVLDQIVKGLEQAEDD